MRPPHRRQAIGWMVPLGDLKENTAAIHLELVCRNAHDAPSSLILHRDNGCHCRDFFVGLCGDLSALLPEPAREQRFARNDAQKNFNNRNRFAATWGGPRWGVEQAAMAKKKRYSRVEIATKLAKANDLARQGKLQSEIARTLGVSVMTLHRWRKAPPGPQPALVATPEARDDRMAELQLENSRLRQLVTDLLLGKIKVKEVTHSQKRSRRGKGRDENPDNDRV
jgi:putative transposase